MAAIEMWLRQPAAQAVGWALLQFVWQGVAIGVLTAAALFALRRSAADVRYVVSSIGLALMLTLPVVTGAQRYQALTRDADAVLTGTIASQSTRQDRMFRLKAEATGDPTPATDIIPTGINPASRFPLESWMPVLLIVWLAGVTILTLRLLTGWILVRRLCTRGVSDAGEELRAAAARLARQLHISRRVTLLASSIVDVPTVVGFVKPVILVPVGALAGLTAQQVEAILAHELAHIRRHDYLVNLLQTLVETVLFYHPAVWWLSRRIRIERENCCDDLAVSLCGDPVAYATALADLEALRSEGPVPARRLALAATGGSLLQRVRRLLGAPASHSGRGPAWLAAIVALSLIGCVAYSADGSHGEPVPGIVHARAFDAHLMRDLTRAVRTELRSARAPIRSAAGVLRESIRSVAVPVAAAIARHRESNTAVAPPAAAIEPQRVPLAARPPVASTPEIALAELPTASEPLPALAAPVAAAAAPAPPVAAAAPQSTSISHQVNDSSGNWSWSNNGEHLEISYSGSFDFTDDDTDVRQLSAGGWLKISDGKWLFGRHSVEIRERNGQLEHLYYVNASSRPYEPEGREWLRQNLPRFVRNSGIGADARVARLLKNGGAAAVLAEIGRLDTGYARRIYYTQLFRQASLTPEQYRQALALASREMASSSYDMAELLIAVSAQHPADEASRAAWFQAASVIRSDYDQRRVYSTMLKRGPVSPAILGGILSSARSIASDYDLSELLRQVLAQQTIDESTRAAFFAAVATIGSDYEHHRVLSAVVGSGRAIDAGLLQDALSSAATLHNDYELSTFLQSVLRQNGVEAVRAPFFSAVNTIDSAYERGRVLQMVVRRPDVSDDTLRAVLQSSGRMNGYELSQLLQLVARSHALGGDLRQAYMTAADRLGGYDQTQALAALARSERRQ